MKSLKFGISILMLLALCSLTATAETLHKEFDGTKTVSMDGASGDWTIKSHRGKNIIIDVVYDDNLKDIVDFKFRESSGKLTIEEDMRRSHNWSGSIKWTVLLPAETDVELHTASGDVDFQEVNGDLEISVASGDIQIRNHAGDMDLKSASGDISVRESQGNGSISTASGDVTLINLPGDLNISTASGDVDAEGLKGSVKCSTASGDIQLKKSTVELKGSTASGNINGREVSGSVSASTASGDVEMERLSLTGSAKFSTASGDISLSMGSDMKNDLTAKTASGDITLDLNRNSFKGSIEATVRTGASYFRSDLKFTETDSFTRDGRDYHVLSCKMGNDASSITMNTYSGQVKLSK